MGYEKLTYSFKKKTQIFILFFSIFFNTNAQKAIHFGNSVYVNLCVGQTFNYHGNRIVLKEINGNKTRVEVNDKLKELKISRRELPTVVDSVRLFVADQKNIKSLTTDNQVHGLLKGDALLCLSSPESPLLDADNYVFPISKKDNYQWSMTEDSHMYAYLGLSKWVSPDYYRSHEGIDLNMHDARGRYIHPLVAIENSTVVLVADSTVTKSKDGCIILKSELNKNIYYVYKHTNPKTHKVKAGQYVKKGEELSFIWGDQAWGHLHFAVVYRERVPEYIDRYYSLINFFPQLYELYNGTLEYEKKIFTHGIFEFGSQRWIEGNSRKIDEYNELIGYGWEIDWCPAQKVEGVFGKEKGNARLKKHLHEGTCASSINPENNFKFNINVENGAYNISCVIGDYESPSEMRLYFENIELGNYETEPANFKEVEEQNVIVNDGMLTIKIELPNEKSIAGIQKLEFIKVSDTQ